MSKARKFRAVSTDDLPIRYQIPDEDLEPRVPFTQRVKWFFLKWVMIIAATWGATAGICYKTTGQIPEFLIPDPVAWYKALQPESRKLEQAEAMQQIAALQAATGEKLRIIKPTRRWSKRELLDLAEEVASEECKHGALCIPPIILQAIMDRESTWDPSAISLEKSRIDARVKSIEGEGPLSRALSPFSFGVMQVNWGWHKHTCRDILTSSGGDEEALYIKLFDPRLNIRCAYAVLASKWKEAGGSGAEKVYQMVGLYNGRVAGRYNSEYARDVINSRAVRLMAEMMKDSTGGSLAFLDTVRPRG